jgi:hypothetical protein
MPTCNDCEYLPLDYPGLWRVIPKVKGSARLLVGPIRACLAGYETRGYPALCAGDPDNWHVGLDVPQSQRPCQGFKLKQRLVVYTGPRPTRFERILNED